MQKGNEKLVNKCFKTKNRKKYVQKNIQIK